MEQKQRIESWFEQRLARFTASQINKIIGKKEDLTKGALTYIVERVAEHILGDNNDNFETMAMVWGTDHEPEAVELYELTTGYNVVKCGFVEYGDHAGGSPDGLVDDDGIIEVKCPYSTKNHILYGLIQEDSDIPDDYYWQMMMNMKITGRQWCDFVSYDPRCEYSIFIYRIHANETAFETIDTFLELAIQKKLEYIDRIESKKR